MGLTPEKAPEPLLRSEMRYRRLFESARDGILILDGTSRKITDANPAMMALLGYSKEEVLGRELWEIGLLKDETDQVAAFQGLEENGYIECELPILTKFGEIREVEFVSNVYDENGQPVVQCHVRDITPRKRVETALQLSQEKYQLLWATAGDAFVLFDRNNIILEANAAVHTVFGYQPEEVLGENIAMLQPERLREGHRRGLQRYLESGTRTLNWRAAEALGLHRNGHEVPLEITFNHLRMDGADLFAGFIRDITERKQVESDLRNSQEWFRQIAESINEVFWMLDPRTPRILYVSPAYETIWGRSCQSLYENRRSFMDALHPEDRERFFSSIDNQVTPNGYNIEYRIVRPDGSVRWIWDRAFPVFNESGEVYRVTGVAQDVTDRKEFEALQLRMRAELELRVAERTADMERAYQQLEEKLIEHRQTSETLREAQQMLQLVMNHIPQAIFWKDRNSAFLGCNYRFAQDLGFSSPQELIGRTAYDVASAEHAPAYQADDQQVMETDTPKLNIEEPLTKADGSQAWLRTNKIPLHDSQNNVVGLLGTYEDITLQKEAEAAIHQAREEADAANLAKSVFLSRMSHELRTPLNAILGFGQVLSLQNLTPRQHESIGYILKGGNHLLSLINEVLDIARVESGHTELSIEAIPLVEVVSECCALVQPLAQQRDIRITNSGLSVGTAHVLADQQRLKQVLLNLLSNAIKYNQPAGEVEITVAEVAHERIQIRVRDTGFGLTPQDVAKLFTPFERLRATDSDIEGTGLGLVLTQRLVEAMGGKLDVESTIGVGTTFSVELPQAQPPVEAFIQSPIMTRPEAACEMECRYTVLSVEDNLSNIKLLEVILENRPEITLLTAMQGSLGLDLARQHHPDLILLDLNLPGLSGSEVLQRLKQAQETKHIPVVVISADATPSQIERLLAMGAKAYLTKPLDVTSLLSLLDEVLGG